MSRDGCVALPRGAMGLSAVCDCGIPDHTHYFINANEKTMLTSTLQWPHQSSFPAPAMVQGMAV